MRTGQRYLNHGIQLADFFGVEHGPKLLANHPQNVDVNEVISQDRDTTMNNGLVKHDCFKSFNGCFAFVSGGPVHEKWVNCCGINSLASIFSI